MARGPQKHLKRLNAPSHWMLNKMGGVWAPRPSSGPHKLRECLPIVLILRNRLNLALNFREVNLILKDRNVFVDGKARSDAGFPVGFMDVVNIPKANKLFRVLYDIKGRFTLLPIKHNEGEYKLCRVKKVILGAKNIPFIVTHDGRTIRYPNPEIKVNDTIKLNLKTGKVDDVIKYAVNNLATVTGGRNCGRIGQISHIEKHAGSYTMVHLKDKDDQTFVTRHDNIFVIGNEKTPMVSVPSTQGLRVDIIKNRELRLRSIAKQHKSN